jgi:hypothetical protein
MAVGSPEITTSRRHNDRTPQIAPASRYSMFDLVVQSEVRLPIAPLTESAGIAPAWVIRRGASAAPPPANGAVVDQVRCDAPCHSGAVVRWVRRGPDEAWFWHHTNGICHVLPNARRVDAYPQPGVDERGLGLLLAGPVAVFLLHRLGYPSLHSSAVATAHGAVAFFGPKGRGKSTMAACFLRRGATLLTDDVLPLRALDDGVYGVPGPSLMKIWPDTAEHALGLSDELPNLTADIEKKLLLLDNRYPRADGPTRLRALYLLDRYDPPPAGGGANVTIRTLTRWEGLRVLLDQISYGAFLQPSEQASFLPLYTRLLAQAPLRLLRYPRGFEHHDAVYARVLADLEAT